MEPLYDWIIRRGRLVDGTGAPSRRADVALHDGAIVATGCLERARGKQELDVGGRVVCPGFIDAHAHADLWLIHDPLDEPKLRQGVTTEILGQDGLSHAPASAATQATVDSLWQGINGALPAGTAWHSTAEYLSALDGQTAVNTAFLVPHVTARIEAMGLAQRPATAPEVEAMVEVVATAMAEGAIGLSTGLSYWPGCYATTAELVALCEAVAPWGGVYVTHLRTYGDGIVSALDEAAQIGSRAGVPVHISHLNHRPEVALPPIEGAIRSGVDVTFDLYPYLVGNTVLAQFIPRWLYGATIEDTLLRMREPAIRERARREMPEPPAGWENYRLSSVPCSGGSRFAGLSLPEAARLVGQDLTDTILDLLVSTRMAATVLTYHTHRGEADLRALMQHPVQIFCSDAILLGQHPHPRAYGTFPRILGRYVRQERVIGLEEAVRKMTSQPAQRFGFTDRGILRGGMAADVVVLDDQVVIDQADFERPKQWPKGIEWVWVNGELVLSPQGPTGATPGRALKPLLRARATREGE